MGESPDLLPGTLDLLILRSLARGTMHGYGIAQHLRTVSEDVLLVGESSLYPALQRLLLQGWIEGKWGVSDNNRRARFYTLTATGRKQLAAEPGVRSARARDSEGSGLMGTKICVIPYQPHQTYPTYQTES